jgi:hypothetical protein
MPRHKRPSKIPLATLTEDQEARLNQVERDAIRYFAGQFDDLQKAIGVLRLGHHIGWKPLVLMHSKKTIAKYEDILGVKLRDLFVDEGPSADRSNGYSIAKKLRNFWKAVSGETPIEGRKEFSP